MPLMLRQPPAVVAGRMGCARRRLSCLTGNDLCPIVESTREFRCLVKAPFPPWHPCACACGPARHCRSLSPRERLSQVRIAPCHPRLDSPFPVPVACRLRLAPASGCCGGGGSESQGVPVPMPARPGPGCWTPHPRARCDVGGRAAPRPGRLSGAAAPPASPTASCGNLGILGPGATCYAGRCPSGSRSCRWHKCELHPWRAHQHKRALSPQPPPTHHTRSPVPAPPPANWCLSPAYFSIFWSQVAYVSRGRLRACVSVYVTGLFSRCQCRAAASITTSMQSLNCGCCACGSAALLQTVFGDGEQRRGPRQHGGACMQGPPTGWSQMNSIWLAKGPGRHALEPEPEFCVPTTITAK